MKKIHLLLIVGFLLLSAGCKPKAKDPVMQPGWKQQLNEEISLLGHRNWILVVDKAFPLQNADGINTIDTGDELLAVLHYTLERINSSVHVKPTIYTDKELEYLTRELVPEIDDFKKALAEVTGQSEIRALLHDSVFVQIDEASKLFKTVVLKTNTTIPYSSVFIQLDCKYWSPDQENQLRDRMMAGGKTNEDP